MSLEKGNIGSSAYSPVTGGNFNGGTLNNTGNGNWWSSTSNSTTNRYNLNWNGSSLNTNNNNRNNGNYVRCIRS
ncbi:hypothetical protein IJI86_00420 [Candidatus Saccharibacteria bacterium]|nr:hypothetical protein [Candidatus Saccharibacteria bacterium]